MWSTLQCATLFFTIEVYGEEPLNGLASPRFRVVDTAVFSEDVQKITSCNTDEANKITKALAGEVEYYLNNAKPDNNVLRQLLIKKVETVPMTLRNKRILNNMAIMLEELDNKSFGE